MTGSSACSVAPFRLLSLVCKVPSLLAPVGFCSMDFQQARVSTRPLPGIPHHHAVTISTTWPITSVVDANSSSVPGTARRYRRCATYIWVSKPNPAQTDQLRQVSAFPLNPAASLYDGLVSWHHRAEAACKLAVFLWGCCPRAVCREAQRFLPQHSTC